MRIAKALTMVLAVTALVAVSAFARVCPVTGQTATGDYFADYEGQRVYFSCKLAKQEFLADPAQYVEGLEHVNDDVREATEQVTCPVTGETIDHTVWADYNGKRVYVHCKLAKKTFLEKPEVYFNKLVEENVALEDAPEFNARFLGASEGFRFAN